ncbi:hypothetical protein BN1263520115 [Stenotrophomonas indicatrix]|nr:hypothetical protein BN1263520115 [Stenotrophomonas indicatrix]
MGKEEGPFKQLRLFVSLPVFFKYVRPKLTSRHAWTVDICSTTSHWPRSCISGAPRCA